jgi:hypothetical protein
MLEPLRTPRSARHAATFELPYAPGWFDRLSDWIDRMPGPNLAYAIGLLVFQFGYVTGLLWLDGRLPVGVVDLRLVFIVVVTPYLLWIRFHLDRVATEAMDAVRPALAIGDSDSSACATSSRPCRRGRLASSRRSRSWPSF